MQQLSLWYFVGSFSCGPLSQLSCCILLRLWQDLYAYWYHLVNTRFPCAFTATVFSWDDSPTGDRDADSRHLSNRLPGLPFPIPGPAQSRERCQCAAGAGNLH